MKKIALTSLLTVFAVSGAHAANVIDGNPLYMPKAGHFYSVTDVASHTKNDTPWGLSEEFGYGVLDNLSVNVVTSLSENKAFDEYAWDDFGVKATFRALDLNGWKADVYGEYVFDNLYNHPRQKPHDAWFDKDLTRYTWTAGVRGGFVASNWTIAGHAAFSYDNTESFNWNEDDALAHSKHIWTVGVDGQYVIDNNWSLLAGVEYKGLSDSWAKYAGEWTGELGVNYNIDATKYVGLYVNGAVDHWKDNGEKGWEAEDGFGFGARVGIDF